MKAFIVAIPLFDSSMAVKAYRLCDRSGERALGIQNDFRRMTEALITPGLAVVEKIGIEPFAMDNPLFVNLNRYQLLVGKPSDIKIPPSKLVCVLPGNISTDARIKEKCGRLKSLHYKLAMEGLPEDVEENPLIPMLDYLILDYMNPRFSSDYFTARTELSSLTLIFYNVPDTESYQRLVSRNQKGMFTGAFYSSPITEGKTDISPVKVNALQLMNQVNSPDFELEDVMRIIERDPYLTISLLRFINSAAVGLSFTPS